MNTQDKPKIDAVIVSCFRTHNLPEIIASLKRTGLFRKIHIVHQLPSRTPFENVENIFLDANYGPGIRHLYAADSIKEVEFVWFQDDDWRIDERSSNVESVVNSIQTYGPHSAVLGPVIKGYEEKDGGRFSRIDNKLVSVALQSPPFFVLGRLHIVRLTSLIRCAQFLRDLQNEYPLLYWRSDDIVVSFVISTIEQKPVREIPCDMIEMPACQALSDEPEHRHQRAELSRKLMGLIGKRIFECYRS